MLIGHKLSWGVQRRAWKLTRVQDAFSAVACVSQAQVEYAKSADGMGIDAASFIPDKVDERFFRPLGLDDEGYVFAVGQEQRDYATLLRAMSGSGRRLVIVASSPWATSKIVPDEAENVTVLSGVSFSRLRELYARARLVVVPVHDVDYAAGVNGLLEGMAMGRPVVSSKTRGLEGYVEAGTTGLQVPPADAAALRRTIDELWDDPKRRASLASAGRAAIEARMTLDHYVDRLAQLATERPRAGASAPGATLSRRESDTQ